MRLVIAALAALAFAPAAADAFTPAQGSYAGRDHSARPVHFTLDRGYVEAWRLDNRIDVARAYVSTSTHSFHVREGHHDLKGHWTDARHVTGVYGYYRQTSRGLVHVTIHWTATRV
ncbi:MAG: hypothetical protein JWM73_2785 [Solirubrobacterales bacterium]|jgi:hypothetical protein|nr:hypothetical protein [Solirubrobacterales bacterium]